MTDEQLYYKEITPSGYGISIKIKKVLFSEESKYQKIEILDSDSKLGKILTLDDLMTATEGDEYFYHEMITHIPMMNHPCPKTVLVIGGGDGGTVREILKHKTVEKVVLCEIDDMVIEVSKKYLPTISCKLDDPKVEIKIEDAIKYIKDKKNMFDIILIDTTDPMGPGVGLFTEEFYTNVKDSLKEGGIMVAQSESPVANEDESTEIFNNIGVSYSNLNDYQNAEKYLKKALELNPNLPQIYLNMSDVYYRQKEIAFAIDCLRAGEIALPENTVIPHYLARILMEDAQQDLAIDELDKILELEPENYDAYYDLARIYFDMGNWEAAISNFENILEFKDQNELIYFYLAEAYEANDEIDKAISNYLKSTAVNNHFHPAFKKLGMLFMARGDFDDAIEYFEDYTKFDIPDEEKETVQKLIDRIKCQKGL